MATAGQVASLGTAGSTLFTANTDNANAGCSGFYIYNSDGSIDVLVNIPGLHAAGEFFYVAAGKEKVFRTRGTNGIKSVFAKSASSTVKIDYGIIEIH